jgi:enamine deaminase RidA (YjgF/YER057c/UK114 family)
MAPASERLRALGIELVRPAAAAGAYLPWVRSDDLLFLAGHIARRDGRPWVGQLGEGIAVDEGRAAARQVAIDLLATLQAATGDLERIRRIVKLLVLVNSSPSFTDHPAVANGASELLTDVLAERGAHARSAFGVA